MAADAGRPNRTRRNRAAFLGLVAIAVVPLVVAYLMYRSSTDGRLWGTTNQGEFVAPVFQLESLGLESLDGAPGLGPEPVWRLLTVTDGACSEGCETGLHQLRQLHLLLNRDAPRLRRVLVYIGALESTEAQRLGEAYPELRFVRGHPGPLRPGIFLVDPLGNVVLYYRYDQAGRPVLDDLKRLLKVSQIG